MTNIILLSFLLFFIKNRIQNLYFKFNKELNHKLHLVKKVLQERVMYI